MDPRVLAAIQEGERMRQEEVDERANEQSERDARRKAEVEEAMPEAREWVQKNLFGMIAVATSKGKKEVTLNGGYLTNPLDWTGPRDAIVAAVNEIDGIRCIKREVDVNIAGKEFPPTRMTHLIVTW